MSPRSFEHLLPSTFEERGAAVPFTTPVLAQSRVRKDWRDRLEIVVGQFSGGPGAIVIPWTAIAEMISLTTHDVLLHEEVMTRRALDPYTVRMAALEVAKSGLAGPEVVEAATKTLALDEEAKALNQVVLILKVIEEAEPSQAKELMRTISNPDGQERVREALFGIADRLQLDAKAFDNRLSELGVATYAVGTAWSPAEGRLRRLVVRLGEFADSIAAWGSERLGDSADQAAFTVEIANYTLKIARDALKKFDAAVGSPRTIVAEWDSKSSEVRGLANRLAWLMDGWQLLIDTWEMASDETAQIDALASIVPRLPFIPAKEVDPDKVENAGSEQFGRGRRWVKMNEDWKTGEPDIELVHRLEQLKTRAG
jgi:hypothetical protein